MNRLSEMVFFRTSSTRAVPVMRSSARLWAVAVLLLTTSIATTAQRANSPDVTTISVGTTPVAMAVNPATQKVYVANRESRNVTIIDSITNSTTTVATGGGPAALAVNPATNKIYVVNMFDGTVTVIDGADNSTSTVPVGLSPRDVAINPFTNKIYVANEHSNSVTVIDGATNASLTIGVGSGPRYIAVNPVTNKIYVPARSGSDVTVIDGADNSKTTVGIGSSPEKVAINPVTNTIHVIGSIFLTRIAGANNSAETIFFGAPSAIAIDAVTNLAYISDSYGTVGIVEGTSNRINFVELTGSPPAIAVNSSTSRVYVALRGNMAPGVAILNGAGTQLGFVPLATEPMVATLNSAANVVYVASSFANLVHVIDEGSFTRDVVTVTGRVVSPTGAGVRGAMLSLLDADGRFRTVTTNPFGYYRFANVPAGTTIVRVNSKRRFANPARGLNVSVATEPINFVADE